MSFSHNRPVSAKTPHRDIMTLLALVLLLALIATLGLRAVLTLDALAPAVATLLFVSAAATGIAALLVRRHAPRARILDVVGLLTFVGVIISIMIESDQMTRLMMLSDNSESN